IWPHDLAGDLESQLARIADMGPGPWFLKPSLGGSSVAMGHARNATDVLNYLRNVNDLLPGEGILVEQAVQGIEITVGMLSTPQGSATCLPVVEIRPGGDGWFDYQEKYSEGGAQEFCPPKNLSKEAQVRAQAAASLAWTALGLTSYARLDFIVTATGDPVLLEANTLPGFTPRSLLPQAAAEDGLSFECLCVELCLRAWIDHTSHQHVR
ncbi:MAG: hypothetical protein P1U53_18065, partial [Sulfitobacter sp.]|nr:hypothetical protein [Sulfitobacter sp.]